MRIDRRFREAHALADGTRVTLRLLRPTDGPLLRATYARLSPESRYRRFLYGPRELSDKMLAQLLDVDGTDRLAVVAVHESLDFKEESIVGVARLARLPEDPAVAEGAITVVDDMQNRGLAKLLAGPMREAALERGMTKLRAEVLLSNEPMRHLLERAGAEAREETADTMVFDVDLAALSEGDGSSLNRILAAAAQSMAVFIRRLAPASGPRLDDGSEPPRG